MIKQVGIVAIPVSDQDRAKKFYVEMLGMECRSDVPFEPGKRWINVAPKGASTTLTLVTWFENMKPGGIAGLMLTVDDLDVTYADLVARGVEFTEAPHTEKHGRFASLNDPDGNQLVLRQPPA